MNNKEFLAEERKLINIIFNPKVDSNGKLLFAHQPFPKFVNERIKYFIDLVNDVPLTPFGQLAGVLGEEQFKDYLGVYWLEPTKEFENWLNDSNAMLKQMAIASQLIYGNYEEDK